MSTRLLPMPGMRLGKYQLLERLAVGGMAEIFLARSAGIEGFEKLVVCKCILAQRASDEDFVNMFIDEARLAAQLHHPNVAHVFDIGREGDLHFFAMEYVHGADVDEILQVARPKGPVPLEPALTIAIGAAAGLHYAHEKVDAEGHPLGIVHRDVSPSNVLVSFDGGVKVVDFGIAKATSQWARTRTGIVKGKLSCMSPEQCRGETVDRRSDVFALGVLLYDLTTGVRPFQGESEYAIIRRIVDEDAVPPSSHRDDYPPKLEAIVMRALSRDVGHRYATAQELQIDLETFAREENLVLSAVELSRYMRELLGDRRPPRTEFEPERFLHQDLGRPGGTEVTQLLPTAAPRSQSARTWRGSRRVVWSAAAVVAVLAGGGYLLAGGTRWSGVGVQPPSQRSPITAAPSAPAPEAPPPVRAAVVESPDRPPAPPTAARAPEPPPTISAAPPRRRRAPARKVRPRPTRTSSAVKATVQQHDLDAPFPR